MLRFPGDAEASGGGRNGEGTVRAVPERQDDTVATFLLTTNKDEFRAERERRPCRTRTGARAGRERDECE